MPHLVRERLFIGDISDAAEVLQGRGNPEITHVLSLLSSASISFFSDWRKDVSISAEEVRKEFFAGSERAMPSGKLMYSVEMVGPDLKLQRMAVPLRDTEDENLVDYLDSCFEFIDKGRKEGSVLVHCFAGVSRSASVLTAYLMRTERKSLEDALESLRESSESVCPNDGFLDQLKMFEEMSFKVDVNSPIYKRFRLKMLGHSYKLGEKVSISLFASDPGSSEESGLHEKSSQDHHTTTFRCKKCRRVIALQDHVIHHEPGEGESSFKWQRRNIGYGGMEGYDEPVCSSLFVEPLWWMTSAVEEGALEGKLSCIHCGSRLGHFNWSGIQCNCGSWITPAFQIHKSRVDSSAI